LEATVSLETDFDKAMMAIYTKARDEAGYTASIFHQMLIKDRGVLTAKKLINMRKPSDGYTALFERGRLDLTVEAVLVENAKWHPLFTQDDIRKAQKRLEEYQYTPKSMI
jgi:hypothetical protein